MRLLNVKNNRPAYLQSPRQPLFGSSRNDFLINYNEIIMIILKVLDVKKILAVNNATYAVAKRKPEKIRLAGNRTLTSAIPVQRSNQLS